MINQQLIDYINQIFALGKSGDEIKISLTRAGWPIADVEENLKFVLNKQQVINNQEFQSNISGKLNGVFQLIKTSFKIYKSNFLTISGIIGLFFISSLLTNLAVAERETNIIIYFVSIFLYAINFIFGLLIIPLLIFAISENTGFINIFKNSFKIFIPYIRIIFVYSAIISFFALPIIALVLLYYFDKMQEGIPWLLWDKLGPDNLKIALYGLSFVLSIPIIILMILFSLWPYAFIFENQKGLSAILRSKNLTSGRFWATVWRFLTFGLILLLSIFIVIIIPAIIAKVFDNPFIIDITASVLIDFFALPLVIIYVYALYKNLVDFKSGAVYLPKQRTKIIFSALAFLGMPLVIFFLIFSSLVVTAKDIVLIDDSNLRLPQTNISEQDNAFPDFYQSSEVIQKNWSSYESGKREFIENIIKGKNWDDDFVKQLISENEQALNYFEKGVTKASLSSAYEVLNPLGFLGIARLNVIKALSFLKYNEEEKAFEQVFKVLKMGQMIESSQESLLAALIGRTIKEIGFEGLKTVITASKNLSKERLMNYLWQLDNFKEGKSGLVNAFKSEYINISQSKKLFEDAFKKENQDSVLEKLFLPVSDNLWRNYLYQPNKTLKIQKDIYQGYIDNAGVNYCKDIKSIEMPILLEPSSFDRLKLFFTGNSVGKTINSTMILVLNVDGLIYQRCAEDFSWISAKLLLAIKLYQLDNGENITALNELVPNYISEIPNDPFDGQQIRFLLEKRIIYSVGKDLKDDGGDENNDLIAKIEF